jgi:hypothetical protein
MITLTLLPVICHPYGAQRPTRSTTLQILTVHIVFLTALANHARDNENRGGIYETQHNAESEPNRMDGIVLCNSHRHPPPITDRVPACSPTRQEILSQFNATMDSCLLLIFEHLYLNRRNLLLVMSGLLSVLPSLAAQAAKELMADACYNELQQRKQDPLWASQVLRRSGGHVYLEKELETAGGPVHRLLLIDGHEPSPSERRQDDVRLRKLMNDPNAREAMKKARGADERKVDDLLRVIPDAFLFQDQGKQGGLEKLGFSPNPTYKPKSYEETTLHAMSGTVLIDLQEKRLVEISATLTQQVEVGHGLIGSLKKGGMIEVKRTRLSAGIWKTSSTRIDINGHIVLLKSISKKQDETQSNFTPEAPDMTIEHALEKLFGN